MQHSRRPSRLSSLQLLTRAREGDSAALDDLLVRYGPRLRRWAHGRLPRSARDLVDTDDIVQDVLLATVRRLPTVDLPDESALQAYLRQAIINRIQNERRRVSRRPPSTTLSDGLVADERSPLEAALGADALRRYEQALARLSPSEQTAISGRLELGLSFGELAEVLGKPSSNAARMFVSRALINLARAMQDGG